MVRASRGLGFVRKVEREIVQALFCPAYVRRRLGRDQSRSPQAFAPWACAVSLQTQKHKGHVRGATVLRARHRHATLRGRPARRGLVAGASTSRTKREVSVDVGKFVPILGILGRHTGSVSFCQAVCTGKGTVWTPCPPLPLGSCCLAAGVGLQPLDDFAQPPHG
jgi:hypothetical protein